MKEPMGKVIIQIKLQNWTDVAARLELAAALADDDATGADSFAAKGFHAEAFAIAVAPVADAALTFLMCHKLGA